MLLLRERKNTNTGWYWRFLDWAFNFCVSETNDEIPATRSSGLLIHRIDSVKDIEAKLIQHQIYLQKEHESLHREVMSDNSIAKILFLPHGRCCSWINRTGHGALFRNADPWWRTVGNGRNSKVLAKQSKVVSVHMTIFRKMIKIEIIYDEGVSFLVSFPLVTLGHFHRIQIVPYPDEATYSINDWCRGGRCDHH